MRLPIVLFALVATPFLAATAQDQAASVQVSGKCGTSDVQRSALSWSRERPLDPFGRDRTGCSPLAPVVTPGGGGSGGDTGGGTTTGSVEITGTVYNAADWSPIGAGWVVTVTGTTTASTVTNADGSYALSNLPAGTYTICQVVQAGWVQTYPSSGSVCPTGHGYTFTLGTGASASFVDYGDIIQ